MAITYLKTGKPESVYKALTKPIIVSKDGHILDGHHRWAAMVALDISNGGSGDIEMDVIEVDQNAEDMIKDANKFTEDMGMKTKEAEKEPTKAKLEGFYGKISYIEHKLKETYHSVEMKESAYVDIIEGKPVVDKEKLEAEIKAAEERKEHAKYIAEAEA